MVRMNPTQDTNSASISNWLAKEVAIYVEREPDQIDHDTDLATYGIDSLRAVALSASIEDQYGIAVSDGLAWDYRTISAIAQFIQEQESSA